MCMDTVEVGMWEKNTGEFYEKMDTDMLTQVGM